MTASEEIVAFDPDPLPPPKPVTVMVAVAVRVPVYPAMVAVIVVVPGDTAVASPEELTVAIAGTLEDQLTWLVRS